MPRAVSADGTPIAYRIRGAGPVVVIVNGAMSTAQDALSIADALAATGRTGVVYDRRARGDSGDVRGSTPAREAEDLEAVLADVSAVGAPVAVLGHSSGAVLALYAATRGSVSHLFLSEPPFHADGEDPMGDLPERLQELVDEGHPDEAISVFQRDGVGLPPELVEQIRRSPSFATLIPLAQSTVYDALLTREVAAPTPAMLAVPIPVTVLLGAQTFPLLEAAAEALAAAIPQAELVRVPESLGHRADPAATARVIADRWRG